MSVAPQRSYDPETPVRPDPRAFRHASPPAGAPSRPGPAPRTVPRPTPRKPGGRPPAGPPGGGGGGGRTSAPLGVRLALLPIRLALIPLRLLGLVLGRLTGGRPWLALILVLGCGVIFLHAATLKTNQLIDKRDTQISALERSTASLRNEVAELGSTDRISRVGREAGMVFPDPEGVGYLNAGNADVGRAIRTFGPPSPDWQPAPNPSTQNGDVLNPDGTVAESGVPTEDGVATENGVAPADGTTPDAGTGATADGTGTEGTGTGDQTATPSADGTETGDAGTATTTPQDTSGADSATGGAPVSGTNGAGDDATGDGTVTEP